MQSNQKTESLLEKRHIVPIIVLNHLLSKCTKNQSCSVRDFVTPATPM